MTSFGSACILENSVWFTYEYSRSPWPVPSFGAGAANAVGARPAADALDSTDPAEFDSLAAEVFAVDSLGIAESNWDARGAWAWPSDRPIVRGGYTGWGWRSRKIATPMTPTLA